MLIMKKRLQFLFTFFFLTSFFVGAFGQTAEEIIQKHIAAQGGCENWDKIQSMKITGMFTAFSEMKPYVEYKARGGKFYSRHHKGQHEIMEGCNGKSYWVNDPWFELGFPHIANEAEQFVIEQTAEFCTPFFRYKERGFSVEYEGMEETEGKNTFRMALTRKDGKKEFWFLDAETFLPVKHISQWADFASPVRQEAFFDDYRQVGAVVIPFYTERVYSIRHTVTEIQDIAINPIIDEGIFNIPLSSQMQKLAFMEGKWKVIFERLGRNRQLNFADSTMSEISFAESKNLIEESIAYSAFFPIRLFNNLSFNTEIESYVFNSFNGFNSNMEIYSGDFENDTLNLENVRFFLGGNSQNQTTSITIIKVSDDEFVVNYNHRQDGGAPSTAQRFTYTRVY